MYVMGEYLDVILKNVQKVAKPVLTSFNSPIFLKYNITDVSFDVLQLSAKFQRNWFTI